MNRKFLPALVFSLFFATLLVSFNIFGLPGFFVPLLVMAALILASHPKKLLAAYWLLILFVPSLEVFFPSILIKTLEQGMGIYILFLLFADFAIRRHNLPGIKQVSWCLSALMILILASSIANKVPPDSVLFFILIYIKPFGIFFFTLQHLNKVDSKKVFRILILSLALQLLLNAAAYIGVNPLPRIIGRVFVDFSVGTLGSSHDVAYYMIVLVILMCSCLRHFNSVLIRTGCYLLSILSAIQFYLAYAIHAYPLYIGGFVLEYILYVKRVTLRHVLSSVILVTMLASVIIALFASGPQLNVSRQIAKPALVRYRIQKSMAGPKGIAYRDVFLRAHTHLDFPLLGGGPGNYTSPIAFLNERPLTKLPHLAYRFTMLARRMDYGTSISKVPWTGMLTIWGELGPLGWMLFWGLHVYAALRIFRQRQRQEYSSLYRIILAEAFVPTMIVFLLLNIIIDASRAPHLCLGIWIWAASVWNTSNNTIAQQDTTNNPSNTYRSKS